MTRGTIGLVVTCIRLASLLTAVVVLSGASSVSAASASSVAASTGAGREGEADSSLPDPGGRHLQAAAAANGQLTSPAGVGGSRRRLHAPTHDHTPAYHAHWLKPHAHTPAYYAKKAAIAARAGSSPSPAVRKPTRAASKPKPPTQPRPKPHAAPRAKPHAKKPHAKPHAAPHAKPHRKPHKHHPPPPKLTPAQIAKAKAIARAKAAALAVARAKAIAAAKVKYIQEEKAAELAAAIARVTYPTPVNAPIQYGGGAIQGQVPFRYNPLFGVPPRVRTGYYYLPSGWQNKALPVMVLMHGLEGYGLSIMYAGTPNQGDQSTFQDNAEQYKFILIAPDSQSADLGGWRVPFANQAPTPDVLHIQACLEYVRGLPNVKFDTRFIAAAGVSNGGFMATPLASRYSIYTHSLNLHSTFFIQQLQGNAHKIWFSTGVYDSEYPPSKILALVKLFEGTKPTWPKPAYNLQFLIPHTLGDPLERTDAIHWWLGLGNYELFLTLAQLRAIGSVG